MEALPLSAGTSTYDSDQRPSPFVEEFQALVQYRDLVRTLIYRDFVTRYKRSFLGVAWSMLNPLGTMIVISVIFSRLFGAVESFPAFVISALVPWTFFLQTSSCANRNIVWGGGLLKRIYMPKAALVVATVGSNLINFAFSLVPLLAVILIYGRLPGPSLVLLPVAVLCLVAFTLGVGFILAAVTTFFPDMAEFYQVFSRAWFFLTPVMWPPDRLGGRMGVLILNLNPMTDIITIFRDIFYHSAWPEALILGRACSVSMLMLVLGWSIFTRHANSFVYRI